MRHLIFWLFIITAVNITTTAQDKISFTATEMTATTFDGYEFQYKYYSAEFLIVKSERDILTIAEIENGEAINIKHVALKKKTKRSKKEREAGIGNYLNHHFLKNKPGEAIIDTQYKSVYISSPDGIIMFGRPRPGQHRTDFDYIKRKNIKK